MIITNLLKLYQLALELEEQNSSSRSKKHNIFCGVVPDGQEKLRIQNQIFIFHIG